MAEYSGADWIERQLKVKNPDIEMSQLGRNVADLLGELFYGIYHLNYKQLIKVDWANPYHIKFILGWKSLSTFDFDELTRLVFLAHYMAIRVEISPHAFKYIRLMFHQRNRKGNIFQRHPTLDEAVSMFKKKVGLSEYLEDN